MAFRNELVGTINLADGSVTTPKLANLAVTTAKIDNLAVGTAQIAALAVTTAKIGNLAVGTAQIASLAVTNAKIASLAVDKLTAGTIAAIAINLASGGVIGTAGFVSGDPTGWQIKGNGDAEFNNVVIRGTLAANVVDGWLTTTALGGLRTAGTGTRIEISSYLANGVNFYTGAADEAQQAQIFVNDYTTPSVPSPFQQISLSSGKKTGHLDVSLHLTSQTLAGGGGYATFETDNLTLTDPTGLLAAAYVSLWANLVDIGTTGATTRITGAVTVSDVFTVGTSGSMVNTSRHWGTIRLSQTALQTAWSEYPLIVDSGAVGNPRAGLAAWANGSAIGWRLDTSVAVAWQAVDSVGTSYIPILASAFTVSSSERTKTNQRSLDAGATDLLRALRPVRFNRPALAASGVARHALAEHNEDKDFLGLVAEDVADVIPEAILWSQAPDGSPQPEGIDYAAVTAVIAAAVQELDGRLLVLETKGH